jgi:hypothetical protein
MMRDIKFRAWDKKEKGMRTVTLLNTAYMGTEYQTIYFNHLGGSYRHLPEVELMQFTGLKDKNGKEIYEGDVLSYDDDKGVVTYVNCEFALKLTKHETVQRGLLSDYVYHPLAIIGNIYENAELMEAK